MIPVAVRIRSQCPACGEVRLEPASVTLILDSSTPGAIQEFRCPSCSEMVRSEVTSATAEMLMALGAPVASVFELRLAETEEKSRRSAPGQSTSG